MIPPLHHLALTVITIARLVCKHCVYGFRIVAHVIRYQTFHCIFTSKPLNISNFIKVHPASIMSFSVKLLWTSYLHSYVQCFHFIIAKYQKCYGDINALPRTIPATSPIRLHFHAGILVMMALDLTFQPHYQWMMMWLLKILYMVQCSLLNGWSKPMVQWDFGSNNPVILHFVVLSRHSVFFFTHMQHKVYTFYSPPPPWHHSHNCFYLFDMPFIVFLFFVHVCTSYIFMPRRHMQPKKNSMFRFPLVTLLNDLPFAICIQSPD